MPLAFKEIESKVEGLPFADYWAELDGKELPIVFERKALGDLFSTLTGGYKRFRKEIDKVKEAGVQMEILIEGSLTDVLGGYEYSTVPGKVILKTLSMLKVRHNVNYHFFNNRDEMSRYIHEVFSACQRNYGVDRKVT